MFRTEANMKKVFIKRKKRNSFRPVIWNELPEIPGIFVNIIIGWDESGKAI